MLRLLIAASVFAVALDVAYSVPHRAFAQARLADDLDVEESLDDADTEEEKFPDRGFAAGSGTDQAEAQIRRALQYAPGVTCELKFYAAGIVTMCQ